MSFPIELDEWFDLPVEHWRRAWGLPRLHILGLTGSTNDDVRALAEQGSPPLTVVIASQQRAGRGQHGRTWAGAPGKSLHLSALLRPDSLASLGCAPVRIGLYVARALDELGARVRLKWPNDLILGDRKVGGILCEGVAGPRNFLVAGVGINVAHAPEDFPDEIQGQATSLTIEGCSASLPEVAGSVVSALQSAAPVIDRQLTSDELQAIAALDVTRNRRVQVNGTTGVARGIAADGALLVSVNGMLKTVRRGTLRLIVNTE